MGHSEAPLDHPRRRVGGGAVDGKKRCLLFRTGRRMTLVRRDFGALAAPGFFDGSVRRILELQRADGSIPWYDGGVIDAWNHTHAAMGLSVAGCIEEAQNAYEFLARSKLPDGSWWGQYGSAVPLDTNKYEGTGNEP